MRAPISLLALAAASLFAASAQAQTLIGGGKIAPSFPITISQPGNYKLAADLTVPAGLDGIVVNADNVTLDLNGFSIIGAGNCFGGYGQLSCTGTKAGISSQKRNLTVRNGRVSGFGWGVSMPFGGLAEDLMIENNANYGLSLQNFGMARGIRANYNIVGVDVRSSVVRDSVIAYGTVGLSGANSLAQGVFITATSTGLSAVLNMALRESYVSGTVPVSGTLTSMGNNLCNGVAC